MIRGLYTAASGMLTQAAHHEVLSSNLANANTPGYRRQSLTVSTFAKMVNEKLGSPDLPTFMAQPTVLYASSAEDSSAAPLHRTGNPSDLALHGEGFFTLQTENGPVYTRNGAFTLDDTRQLVNAEGHPVLTDRGPLTITGTRWEVNRLGDVLVDGQPAGRVLLAAPASGEIAEPLGGSQWTIANPVPVANTTVEQGALEGSNVNAVSEMITLISAMRQFEANQKAVQAIDATLERAVNDIGRA